jgi:hypothetical protein
MKVRNGFVSNSSSASFLITCPNNIEFYKPLDIIYAIHNKIKQKLEFIEKVIKDPTSPYYKECSAEFSKYDMLFKEYAPIYGVDWVWPKLIQDFCDVSNIHLRADEDTKLLIFESFTTIHNDYSESLDPDLIDILFTIKEYGGDFTLETHHDR